MENIIFKQKQAKILMAMRSTQQPWYISTLAKACDTTYVHTTNFINKCESLGLVTNVKHGRIKEIKLTDKGAQVADKLLDINNLLNQKQPQQPPQPPKPQMEAPPQPPQPPQEKTEKK
ncbi:MAG: hypothetical protein M1504_04000 [Candidatus Marsarchaeota archaeon]|nr:hypothetical protein [Candidatus Marsarchaeota archaeon]